MTPTLKDIIPDLPTFNPDEVLTHGRQRQRRKRLTITATALAVAVMAALAIGQLWPNQRAIPPEPAGSPSPSCPQMTPSPGYGEVPSYASGLYWNDAFYTQSDEASHRGAQIGTVPCNIIEIQSKARLIWKGRWPNGSATSAKVGTPIHRQEGAEVACKLTMPVDGAWLVFRSEKC